nr:hypothetical protein [uncultured Draconibacterium sp.]
MKKPKEEIGICKLCGEKKKLSFEHIPPKVAFNKTTRYYSFPSDEYYKSTNLLEFKPKGKIYQGGLGSYCLCKSCNSFLGQNYVRPFSDFVNIGMDINSKYDFTVVPFTAKNQKPLRILKQIASMFIAISDPILTKEYPDFLNFVLKPERQKLSDNFRFYLYLTNEGQYRQFGFPTMTNIHGFICELAYSPYGYVLNINNPNILPELTEITNFKNFSDERTHEFNILLNRLPTHLHMPLDFREIDEIPTN